MSGTPTPVDGTRGTLDFFLPWQGEFGIYIATFVRYVHAARSGYKIVACPPDHRCLFPTADEFYHDYEEILPDRKKWGHSRRPWIEERVRSLERTIREARPEYANCRFVSPFMKLNCYQSPEIVTARFRPEIAFRGLQTDVVITPRRREYMRRKNLNFWQEIVDRLKGEGYSVGAVGNRETSFALERVDLQSWDHGGMEACIEMLERSKLVVAQNTGTAHLAVFLDRPTVLMRNSKGMICWMEVQRNPETFFRIVEPTAEAAVTAASEYLGRAPNDTGVRTWAFKDRREYFAVQKARARRTRGITRRHAGLRSRIIELLKTRCPEARSVLCLGARSRVEVEHFQSAGYEAEGIDLYRDGPIYPCDMSNLDGHERYRDRLFDAFVFVYSLEHCLDFAGLCRRSLPHCRGAVAVAIPYGERAKMNAWACAAFDFQTGDASPGAIERHFPGFRLAHREIMQGCLVFLLCRTGP